MMTIEKSGTGIAIYDVSDNIIVFQGMLWDGDSSELVSISQ